MKLKKVNKKKNGLGNNLIIKNKQKQNYTNSFNNYRNKNKNEDYKPNINISNYNPIANPYINKQNDYNSPKSNYNPIANPYINRQNDYKKFKTVNENQSQYNPLNPSEDRTNLIPSIKIFPMEIVEGMKEF